MDNQQLTKEFIERLRWLNEVEYGDFKRKVGLYINRFAQNLKEPPPEVKKLTDQMRMKVVYNPKPDVETTREEVIELAKQILDRLH